MIASLHLPPRLAGQPLVPCAVPLTSSALLAAHGIGINQREFDVITNSGRMVVGLADEFDAMLGDKFEWGWVLSFLPAWFNGEGEPTGVAWRILPVATRGELAARGHLLEPVPLVSDYCKRRSPDFVHHGLLRVLILELSHALPHDAFTVVPTPDDHAGELVGRIENKFLTMQPPRLLRLLYSLALKRAHEIEPRRIPS